MRGRACRDADFGLPEGRLPEGFRDEVLRRAVLRSESDEIVEVPDTGYYDVSGFIGTLLVGVGLVLFKVH